MKRLNRLMNLEKVNSNLIFNFFKISNNLSSRRIFFVNPINNGAISSGVNPAIPQPTGVT